MSVAGSISSSPVGAISPILGAVSFPQDETRARGSGTVQLSGLSQYGRLGAEPTAPAPAATPDQIDFSVRARRRLLESRAWPRQRSTGAPGEAGFASSQAAATGLWRRAQSAYAASVAQASPGAGLAPWGTGISLVV